MRWLACAWLIALLWGAGAVHAVEIRVTAQRDGDAVLVEASADVHADRQIAWDVLTSYDHYAEFIPDLRSSRILARSGATAIVEQTGVAGVFFYHFPMEVRLAVTEEPFETVHSQAIAGNFREMIGVYKLQPTADGVRFLYSGRLVPAFRLPPLIGLPAVRASVERQFRGLVQEIERRAAAGASEPGSQVQ
jgi:ribosome-associated toxin RatA of RatAB toxin-antitoxin module